MGGWLQIARTEAHQLVPPSFRLPLAVDGRLEHSWHQTSHSSLTVPRRVPRGGCVRLGQGNSTGLHDVQRRHWKNAAGYSRILKWKLKLVFWPGERICKRTSLLHVRDQEVKEFCVRSDPADWERLAFPQLGTGSKHDLLCARVGCEHGNTGLLYLR